MNKIDGYLKNYILHYSNELNLKIEEIVCKEKIASEKEAKELLSFVDSMCDQSANDMKEKRIVLGHPVNTYEAEKATMAIQDFIEDSGFEYLIDDNLELE